MNDLIGLIYEAALDGELWVEALDEVRRVAPCTVASLYSLEGVRRIPTMHQLVGMTPDVERTFLQRWAVGNPVTDAVSLLHPGEVRGLASILDYDALKRTAVFEKWAQPNGYCDVINVMLEISAVRLAAVSLIRSVDDGMADAATIARLELLAPHFLRAVRIGRVLDHVTLREQTFERALDALASAVLLVSPSAGLVHANTAAQGLIRDGLPLTRLAATGAPDGPVLVTMADGVRRMVHTLPLDAAHGRSPRRRLQDCRIIVLKTEPEADGVVAAARSLFQLTRREGDVLFALLETGSLPRASRLLGISHNTVASHMKRLYLKTSTNRQAELVNLVCSFTSPFLEGKDVTDKI